MNLDPVMDGLKSAGQSLEVTATHWTWFLLGGALLVTVGVIVEAIALANEIREEKRSRVGDVVEEPPRHWLFPTHPPLWPKHRLLEVIGAVLVAVGVSGELYSEYRRGLVETKLRTNNADIQAELTGRANRATASAVASAQKVCGLDALVKQTGSRVDVLSNAASDQKARSDAVIAALKREQSEVMATIKSAQKDEIELRAAADTIRDLREQLRELTTDRALSDSQIAAMVKATRAFGKIPFDMIMARDSDDPGLTKQIGLALRNSAHWDWKPRNTLDAVYLPGGLPGVGSTAVAKGVEIDICPDDFQTLSPAVNALFEELLPALAPAPVSRNLLNEKQQQDFFHCGLVHIFVGPKL